ncbi:MAG: PIN domain-containing protein [Anaerolineales bacterium]|nr:PIN domain-containing protein [Anaerolineales bacterium]
MLYVIDTHVLIWYFTGNKRLSADLKAKIDEVRQQGGRLLVPTIVLAEALAVDAKGRVVFDFAHLYQLVQTEPEFEVVDFSVEIFDEVLRIQTIPEIHDRIIVATARFYQANLLTKDGIIRSSSEVDVN